MRPNLLAIVILIGSLVSFSATSQTLPRKYIKYTERLSSNETTFQNQGLPLKANRVSSQRGNINMFYDETLPDSIKIAVNIAKSLWESKINNIYPIDIEIDFEPLSEGIAMEVEVGNYEVDNLNLCYPLALAYQLYGITDEDSEYKDSYITLNSDIDWTCNFSQEAIAPNNLPTMILRGIARSLGFGTSIIADPSYDDFYYQEFFPTTFDKLLYSNGTPLANYINDVEKLKELATSNNVWFHTASDSLKIFAPQEFIPNESLCYFDDDSSLMSHSLAEGNISLAIDNKTIDVLNAIGWESLLGEPEIRCSDIANDGIGSSYASHTFSLINDDSSISNYDWKFYLKNRRGEYELISTGTTSDFTIKNITSPNNYYTNINGDLEGVIQCDYTTGGVVLSAKPFNLSLELKPTIISIDDLTIVPTGKYGFAVQCNVRYSGADYISVEVEEEYDTNLRDYYFNEPYYAHVKTGSISNLYYSWVTIVVANKYGETYETIEFEPTYGAKANESSDITINYDIIQNVNYDYSLIESSTNRYKSEGTLVVELNVPEDITYLEFQRGNIFFNKYMPFSTHCSYPIDTKVVTRERISNGDYYRFFVRYSDNRREYTPTLYTSDFISPEDIEIINGQSMLDSQSLDDVRIFKDNNNLVIQASETIDLVVSDLLGVQIFNGVVSQNMELPIDRYSSPILIVNYSTANNSRTLKIINK